MSNMTLDSLRVQKESSNNKKLNALFEFDNQLWNAQIIKMGLTLTIEVIYLYLSASNSKQGREPGIQGVQVCAHSIDQ